MKRIIQSCLAWLALGSVASGIDMDFSGGKLSTTARVFQEADPVRPGLIRVNIVRGAAASGKYFVPPKTDLLELVALAGGLNADADDTDISVRRRKGARDEVYSLNLREYMSDNEAKPFYFEDNDVVFAAQVRPIVSSNVSTIVGLTASIMGIVMSGIVLQRSLNTSDK